MEVDHYLTEAGGSGVALQWGHGREAVEVTGPENYFTRPRVLQWGHGREAVEVVRPDTMIVVPDEASMGPRP